MNPRNITIYRTYQTSSHRTLGFYTGEEDSVIKFCHLKYDIELDDIALERVPVRKVSRSEVVCFSEIMDQLNDHKERIRLSEEKIQEHKLKIEQ
jgi:hypothetical protein